MATKSISKLYEDVKSAKDRLDTLNKDFYNKLDENTAKKLNRNQAQEIMYTILGNNNIYKSECLKYLIKANPDIIPTTIYDIGNYGKKCPDCFWSFLNILVEFGAPDGAQNLVCFFSQDIDPVVDMNKEEISKLINTAIDRFKISSLNMRKIIFKYADSSTLIKYLNLCYQNTTHIEDIQERILSKSYWNKSDFDFVDEILKIVPKLDNKEFWDKFIEKNSCDKYFFEFIKKSSLVAQNSLYNYILQNNNGKFYIIKEYLEHFPEVDKEPFIEKLTENWDPQKMAREYLTSDFKHGPRMNPLAMLMMGFPPWC